MGAFVEIPVKTPVYDQDVPLPGSVEAIGSDMISDVWRYAFCIGTSIVSNSDRVSRVVDARVWCKGEFEPKGPARDPKPHHRWAHVGTLFLFRNADDAFVFKMRWC